MEAYKDSSGKINIKTVEFELLSSIRGIGNVTIEKLKLLKAINMFGS